MTPTFGYRSKAVVVAFFCTICAVFASARLGECGATYQQVESSIKYDCIIANPLYREFTINMTFIANAVSYNVSIKSTEDFPSGLEGYIKSRAVISIESISGLSPYYDGVRHSSWISDKAVYNDTGGMLLVYSVQTSVLCLMRGNATINGTATFIYLMMIEKVDLTASLSSVSQVLIGFGILAVAVVAVLIIYSLFVRQKMIVNKKLRKINKSGSKLKKYQETKGKDRTGKKGSKERPRKKTGELNYEKI